MTDAVDFVRKTRVLPVQSRSGVRVDLIWATLPYEESAIRRAVARDVGSRKIRFATAEDLILHKIISERERDRKDVEGIVGAQRGRLDLSYLDSRVRALSEALEDPDLLDRYQRAIDRSSGL